MAFELRITARFYEIDRAGIVFFGRVYEYAHSALEEALALMFGHPETMFSKYRFGMPLVHSEADYQHPIRMGDRLIVRMHVERIGSRSITFLYQITGEDGLHRCQVKLVHAFIEMSSFKGIPIPREFLDALPKAGLDVPGPHATPGEGDT